MTLLIYLSHGVWFSMSISLLDFECRIVQVRITFSTLRVGLFNYGLFNDTVSSSDYVQVVSNGRMINE
jgi:hypothetical protein